MYCAGANDSISLAVAEMQQLLQQIDGREWCYTWLSTPAVHAIVCWLAATIYRPHGKFKQSLMYFTQAQQAIDEALRQQGIGQVSFQGNLP